MQPQKSYVVEMERGERKVIIAMKTPSDGPICDFAIGKKVKKLG
jgi:hypothetical protein